ncbi:MAG: zinc ABC transporter substrate-binding protein [Acidimicrobiaceae bacterium]|nr:zinc ABC transporter substrate-binding protein [Acidimicrobiaceae bacterium]
MNEAHEDEGHDEAHDEDEAHDDEAHEDEGHKDEAHEDEGHDEGEAHEDDDGHEDEAHEDEAHDHSGGDDPHVWFDPHRVSEGLTELAHVLATDVGLDPAAIEACMTNYQAELEAVDADIAAKVDQLPAENRKLVTNHEALAYFADRYGFEVIGTVIPSPSSMAQASPAQLEELAEIIEHEGIKAIFAETQHSVDDVEALAARVGDVEVVTLYTGSLGPPGSGADTYLGFLRTNTDLIIDALG